MNTSTGQTLKGQKSREVEGTTKVRYEMGAGSIDEDRFWFRSAPLAVAEAWLPSPCPPQFEAT